jgi:subtilisin family serine protease
MNKKIVGIFICMLLIGTALPIISGNVIKYGELSFSTIPNDEHFDEQWGLHNTGQTGGTPDADIDAPEAWDIETGDSEVVIAILDSGVDWDHPDLADNIWINSDESVDGTDTDDNGFIDDIRGWDFINDDNDPMDDFYDYYHGTMCAGIAGAVGNNEIGVVGVCWNCKIMPIKIINSTGWETDEAAANGIIYAVDNGADIISMSWGGLPSYPLTEGALNYANSLGVIVVAAAGNGNNGKKFYPAAFDNVIAVAATNRNDEREPHSNYGSWVDVAAPGEDIFTTTLDDYYPDFGGTSASTPYVAGLAGLLLSYNPNLTKEEVISIIHDSTDWIETDEYIGNGRINAYKALLIASGSTVPPYKPDTPSGSNKGNIGIEYTYNTRTIDSDGDDIYYLFDWGDDTYSVWEGPFISGITVNVTHKWTKRGVYQVKVVAKDSYGLESEWSDPLSVTMPKNKATEYTLLSGFFEKLIYRFPFFEKILNQIIL